VCSECVPQYCHRAGTGAGEFGTRGSTPRCPAGAGAGACRCRAACRCRYKMTFTKKKILENYDMPAPTPRAVPDPYNHAKPRTALSSRTTALSPMSHVSALCVSAYLSRLSRECRLYSVVYIYTPSTKSQSSRMRFLAPPPSRVHIYSVSPSRPCSRLSASRASTRAPQACWSHRPAGPAAYHRLQHAARAGTRGDSTRGSMHP
jgi:hypothetical protein